MVWVTVVALRKRHKNARRPTRDLQSNERLRGGALLYSLTRPSAIAPFIPDRHCEAARFGARSAG